MLKKIVAIITVIYFLFVMTACSMLGSPTKKYLEAFMKTEAAATLEAKSTYKIGLDTSKASDEIKQKLDNMKNISINIDKVVDNRNRKMVLNSFFSVGDATATSKAILDGDNILMQMPFQRGKYLRLYASGKDSPNNKNNQNFETYKKLFGNISDLWKNEIEKEILANEGSSIENTPDGDIKVTQLSLELTDERAKNILRKLAEIVSRDEALKKSFIDNAAGYIQGNMSDVEKKKQMEEWFSTLPEKLDEIKDKFSVEKLKLAARVDRDSYIIDETLECTLIIKIDGELRMDISSHTTRWNIDNTSLRFDIPQIRREDIIDSKDSVFMSPDMMKRFSEGMNGGK